MTAAALARRPRADAALAWRAAAAVAAAAVVYAGKAHYRDATAADLAWILAPTARAVSWAVGGAFAFEPGAGWVSADYRYIIAPSCAGVNFALAAFVAVVLVWLPGVRGPRSAAARVAGAAAVAYAAALAANAVRLSLAIALHLRWIDARGADPAALHRAVGIAVYLAGLAGVTAAARALDRSAARPPAARALAAAIGAYLAIALAVPALRGAAGRPGFARHAAWVLGGCAILAGVAAAAAAIRRLARRGPSESSRPAARSTEAAPAALSSSRGGST